MIQVLNEKHFIRMPWKNGGGETLELYKEELYGKLQFRISIATVKTSGPFSQFPEINRYLTLLEGNGFQLQFDHKKEVIDQPLQWLSFDGNDNIQCDLISDPCLDFNIMIAKHQSPITVSGFISSEKRSVKLTSTFVYHHRTQTLYILEKDDELNLELEANDLVIEIIKV